MNRASKRKSTLAFWLCALVLLFASGETHARNFFQQTHSASGQIQSTSSINIGENGEASRYDASDYPVAPNRVIVDSNVVPGLRRDPTAGGRILSGESAVVSHVTAPELRNAVSTGSGLRGVPNNLSEIPVLRTSPSLDTRINIRGQLPAGRGRFGDGIIGAQALEENLPLITNDRALRDVINSRGGVAR